MDDKVLWNLVAAVDQMAAEYKDPQTPPERKAELHGQLSEIYKLLLLLEKK